jgi:hypothetical protein
MKRGDKGTLRLCLHCEAPRLGSGWRLIEYKIGNRHARLKNPHTGRTAKIPREAFEQIVRTSN